MDAIATDERAEEQEEKREQQPEKSVSSDLIRGHINTIILRSLYDGDKYGYEIIAEIEHKSLTARSNVWKRTGTSLRIGEVPSAAAAANISA